jgi:hypothetical protein
LQVFIVALWYARLHSKLTAAKVCEQRHESTYCRLSWQGNMISWGLRHGGRRKYQFPRLFKWFVKSSVVTEQDSPVPANKLIESWFKIRLSSHFALKSFGWFRGYRVSPGGYRTQDSSYQLGFSLGSGNRHAGGSVTSGDRQS